MHIRELFFIALSIIAAICLTLLPLPEWAVWWRPAWLALVIIFWSMNLPSQINVGTAWCVGLLMDVLNGTLFGEHAFLLALMAYLANRFYRRMRFFPPLQQSLCVGIFILIYQILLFIIQGLSGTVITQWQFWLTPFTSMMFWPLIFSVLQNFRKRYRIA